MVQDQFGRRCGGKDSAVTPGAAPDRRTGPWAADGAVRHQVPRRRPRDAAHSDGPGTADDKHKMTAVEGVAALSLDALSSVAYGPEAVVLALAPAGVAAERYTVPIAVVITVLLAVLVLSYRQVIAVHPDGGGAYAVAKKDLGAAVSLLAAASLVVDYVLTVAVSLSAGAASLASVFPAVGSHLLAVCLGGLVVLTAVNLLGVAESARALMLPTLVFIISILAILVVGPFHAHPVATIGRAMPIKPVEALGVVLLLKAFAAGCSALTGVEAIANGVPSFRDPAVRRAQRTEVTLGVLLGVMLIGLALLIRAHHVVPRGGVTVLAQLTAGAFGTGWPFYVSNISVTLILALAANTSFGGLPVLMTLRAKDNRLPHIFGLRAERPVYRYGVVALALLAGLLLIVLGADTSRLLPLFAVGVFIGFTISQTGLVRHWFAERPPRWRATATLNGVGALLTAAAAVIFFVSKFRAGAWLLLFLIPLLMLLFSRVQRYYDAIAVELGLGRTPAAPAEHPALVVVPIASLSAATTRALSVARSLGPAVVAIAADTDGNGMPELREQWADWAPGVDLTVLPSPRRGLVGPVVDYVKDQQRGGTQVTVLIVELQPRRRRYEILHNQRGVVLAAVLRARTDAVVATLPYRLDARAPARRRRIGN